MTKFVIHTAQYDENVGGIIVLHMLAHLLNECGYKCFLQTRILGRAKPLGRAIKYTGRALGLGRVSDRLSFRLHPGLNTPLLPLGIDRDPAGTIMIYSEGIRGNPSRSPHVVRWFLHEPGFHTGIADYGTGEYHVDFGEFLKNHHDPANFVQAEPMGLFVCPPEYREPFDGEAERHGAAYCVRKGKIDPSVDLTGAICIDGLSHAEIAEIFRRVRTFYSFDPYTAYSSFAPLCGAVSIVVPPPGMTRDSWYRDERRRYGIAFGLDDTEWAVATAGALREELARKEAESKAAVERFAKGAIAYFGLPDDRAAPS